MASRWMQSMKARESRAMKVPGRTAGTIGVREHVRANPDNYMGDMSFDFSRGGFIPSEAAQEKAANVALYGTPDGKKPKVCPSCFIAMPKVSALHEC